MFPVRRLRPSSLLRPYVRAYEERIGRLTEEQLLQPLRARSQQFVEFYLADLYRVKGLDGAVSPAPRVVAVGMQTERTGELLLSGDLHLFTIQFTATGFQALFGTPQSQLTNRAEPAQDVIASPDLHLLAEALAGADAMSGRVALAEVWLLRCLHSRPIAPDPIAWASRLMRRTDGRVRIAALAERSGLGLRQFERRFRHQVGAGPKRYSRILRFEHALALRTRQPHAPWTAIAHEAGFTDQAHMIHEFRALSNEGPQSFRLLLGPVWETPARDVENLQSPSPLPA